MADCTTSSAPACFLCIYHPELWFFNWPCGPGVRHLSGSFSNSCPDFREFLFALSTILNIFVQKSYPPKGGFSATSATRKCGSSDFRWASLASLIFDSARAASWLDIRRLTQSASVCFSHVTGEAEILVARALRIDHFYCIFALNMKLIWIYKLEN